MNNLINDFIIKGFEIEISKRISKDCHLYEYSTQVASAGAHRVYYYIKCDYYSYYGSWVIFDNEDVLEHMVRSFIDYIDIMNGLSSEGFNHKALAHLGLSLISKYSLNGSRFDMSELNFNRNSFILQLLENYISELDIPIDNKEDFFNVWDFALENLSEKEFFDRFKNLKEEYYRSC